MSLLEIFGEPYDPGPTGRVHFEGPEPSGSRPGVILLRAVIALLLCGALLWWGYDPAAPWTSLRNTVVLLASYLFVSAVILPQPDARNMGWFGGVLDNPFRWSDDYNRFLLFVRILLWPGRFIGHSLREGGRLLLARPTGRPPGQA